MLWAIKVPSRYVEMVRIYDDVTSQEVNQYRENKWEICYEFPVAACQLGHLGQCPT
jgi:hypothetical protein